MNTLSEKTVEAQDSRELLQILNAVDANASISQRHIAAEVGIALGMVNTYIQRCIRKGWIKTQKIPARRYAYYLTPKGMTEKTRLVKKYMQSSLTLFREAKNQFDMLFNLMEEQNIKKIGIVGSGDFQDIGMLVGYTYEKIEVESITAITPNMKCEAYIITDMEQPQKTYEKLCKHANPLHIYPLPLLNIKETR